MLEQAMRLGPSERVELADALWASVELGVTALSAEHQALLAERVAEADANPGAGRPVDDVIADLRVQYL